MGLGHVPLLLELTNRSVHPCPAEAGNSQMFPNYSFMSSVRNVSKGTVLTAQCQMPRRALLDPETALPVSLRPFLDFTL